MMACNEEGQIGEKMAIDFFKKYKRHCFQSDLIVKGKNGYILVEVKHQEKFEPPPFYGHGLPPYQVKARLDFCKEKDMRCLFLVFDKIDMCTYFQWLDELENGNKFYTRNNNRVIYDIKEFNKLIPKSGVML